MRRKQTSTCLNSRVAVSSIQQQKSSNLQHVVESGQMQGSASHLHQATILLKSEIPVLLGVGLAAGYGAQYIIHAGWVGRSAVSSPRIESLISSMGCLILSVDQYAASQHSNAPPP